MAKTELSFLNVFEVETDGVRRHIVCFLDVVLAGTIGIDARSVVGQFNPGAGGGFDHQSFQLNPLFVEMLVRYMNEQAARSPEIVGEASDLISEWLYVLDPRSAGDSGDESSGGDVLGCFAVDDTGQIVPRSFQYNREHLWFDPVRGVSGLFSDRAFYDWLHPQTDRKGVRS